MNANWIKICFFGAFIHVYVLVSRAHHPTVDLMMIVECVCVCMCPMCPCDRVRKMPPAGDSSTHIRFWLTTIFLLIFTSSLVHVLFVIIIRCIGWLLEVELVESCWICSNYVRCTEWMVPASMKRNTLFGCSANAYLHPSSHLLRAFYFWKLKCMNMPGQCNFSGRDTHTHTHWTIDSIFASC